MENELHANTYTPYVTHTHTQTCNESHEKYTNVGIEFPKTQDSFPFHQNSKYTLLINHEQDTCYLLKQNTIITSVRLHVIKAHFTKPNIAQCKKFSGILDGRC